jgi:hypothetical protein
MARITYNKIRAVKEGLLSQATLGMALSSFEAIAEWKTS